MKIKFAGFEGDLEFYKYSNGRIAMSIEDDEGCIADCTVNIPEARLKEGEVIIKDWSENEGMLQTLIDAHVVEDTGRVFATGFVQANICRLLVKP